MFCEIPDGELLYFRFRWDHASIEIGPEADDGRPMVRQVSHRSDVTGDEYASSIRQLGGKNRGFAQFVATLYGELADASEENTTYSQRLRATCDALYATTQEP
jgi:hypothetical protein